MLVRRTGHMQQAAEHKYDRIGTGYALRRRPDPRIADMIWSALGDADSVVNVGAGTGSYERRGRSVVAVEPSLAMIRQRPPIAAPAVQATAEKLPFCDASFAAALAVLTIHHWSDWRAGLRELVRVSRRRVVLFTWDPQSEGTWLSDYFPSLIEADRQRFPSPASLQEILGEIEITPIPIPHDCTDGFMGAYWRRPSAYLDPAVRSAISSLTTEESSASLANLANDLNTGAWARMHGQVLKLDEIDLGYRLVVASCRRT
jgi:SAM-dependent methyltransferase